MFTASHEDLYVHHLNLPHEGRKGHKQSSLISRDPIPRKGLQWVCSQTRQRYHAFVKSSDVCYEMVTQGSMCWRFMSSSGCSAFLTSWAWPQKDYQPSVRPGCWWICCYLVVVPGKHNMTKVKSGFNINYGFCFKKENYLLTCLGILLGPVPEI